MLFDCLPEPRLCPPPAARSSEALTRLSQLTARQRRCGGMLTQPPQLHVMLSLLRSRPHPPSSPQFNAVPSQSQSHYVWELDRCMAASTIASANRPSIDVSGSASRRRRTSSPASLSGAIIPGSPASAGGNQGVSKTASSGSGASHGARCDGGLPLAECTLLLVVSVVGAAAAGEDAGVSRGRRQQSRICSRGPRIARKRRVGRGCEEVQAKREGRRRGQAYARNSST